MATKTDKKLSAANSGRRWRCTAYDSAAEMAEDFRRVGARAPGSADWMGETVSAAIAAATGAGRRDLVPQAEALLGKLTVALDIPHDAWERSVSGAYPVVAEYLAGAPDPMRRRVRVNSDKAPVRIVVDLTSGCMITAAALVKRGVACLALAMAVAQDHAVELWAFQAQSDKNVEDSDHQAGTMWLVARSGEPLDLARAACALGSVALVRGVGYALNCEQVGEYIGGWAFGGPHHRPERYEQCAREALGLQPADVFIRPPTSEDPLAEKPVEFIQAQLARISAQDSQDGW